MIARLPHAPVWALFCGLLAGCAAIQGNATDPGDESAVLTSLDQWFAPSTDTDYLALPLSDRQSYRDKIVMLRLRAYDIEFSRFERQLWSSGTLSEVGADLAVLALAGIGATTANVATKTAAAAASAGIVGFQATISKDIYYQRTLPALLAQIEANRDKVKLAIVNGLKLPDAQYNLLQAELDLQALQHASGIPAAVGDLTQTATQNQAVAHQLLVDAQFGVGPLAPDLATRKTKIAAAIRAFATSNKAQWDRVAGALGITPPPTLSDERKAVLAAVLKARTTADVNALVAALQPVLGPGL